MVIPTCLSALAFCGAGWLLLKRDFARQKREPGASSEDAGSAPVSKKTLVFGAVMTLLCVGIAAALPLLYEGNSFLFNIKRVCLLSLLWPVACADYKSFRIPNLFILAGCACRAVIFAFELAFESEGVWARAGSELIAAAALAGAALLCGLAIKNSVGFGDVKLFIVMGLMLGLDGIWSAVFLSLIVSFIISVVLLAAKKKTRRDMIPFAPAIMAGTYVSVFITGR
ncbi:MAG: A24 family peptidase [Oscillospiraceae bacterium]|jgi:leader peptidase (prepilin peptidase)/N-methyltransferase|nr:A24 family peptidase [Oscillospiraceae bacterium]